MSRRPYRARHSKVLKTRGCAIASQRLGALAAFDMLEHCIALDCYRIAYSPVQRVSIKVR